MLRLAHGLDFPDLYSVAGARRIDARFVAHLTRADAALAARLERARVTPEALAPKEESALLIDLAPHLEDFLAELFGIEEAVRALEARHHALAPLFAAKRRLAQRRAAHA